MRGRSGKPLASFTKEQAQSRLGNLRRDFSKANTQISFEAYCEIRGFKKKDIEKLIQIAEDK